MVSASQLLTQLKTHFGYDEFLPLQQEVITSVLAKKDTLVLMPTGGGKSLCYQLTSLCMDGITLVVSPLIALMKDQVDALKANGIAAAFINSTLSPAAIAQVQTQAKQDRLKLLYLAPERLALSGFRDFLRTLNVSLIAVDEAHCISEWGHEFRPDYANLKILRRDFPAVPVIALTATATETVRQDIVLQLGLRQSQTFLSSFNRPNLAYLMRPKSAAFNALSALLQNPQNRPAIIYCFSRKSTEALAADLSAQGLKALPYHAGLDLAVRNQTQEKFIRDEIPIIVATIAFGMGIDKPDVRLVVHYDLPKSLESYYQETGRAGRDGLPSQCLLFYSYGDKIKQDFFIDRMENATEQQTARQKLAQMIDFCELHTCRRRFLLEYFGEEWKQENCGNCDVCLTPKEEFDATEITQKILSAVIRTGERFGMSHVGGVLRGAQTERIHSLGHDQLTVYGIARDTTEPELKQIAGLLLARGLLAKTGQQYPTLAVTQAGRAFLRGKEKLTLAKPVASAPASVPATGDDSAYDQALFEQLRLLRKQLADASGVPPFVVFGDVTLRQMATYFPLSPETLARISGVGAIKLEQFGPEFLSCIRSYAAEHGLQEQPIPARRRDRIRTTPRTGSTLEETKSLFLQKLPISQIASRRGLAESTIVGHLERLVMAGEPLDLSDLMPPPERLAKIEEAFKTTGELALVPVLALLGEEFTFQELHMVRMYLHQHNPEPARPN
ncbi:MAG: DNA helicase RecQ [Dehalococcoidia bacterium]|nr:DNA helicase RecQ [Dehalococcoidia bacterium]